MPINPERLLVILDEVKELYVDVKEAIIFAENFDPDHDVYLSPLNELRNSFDHIMRSLVEEDNLEEEFHEAKEHLFRAGYDAYEVLAINVASKIVRIVEKYDIGIITAVFPSYYTDIKRDIINIQVGLGEVRAKKKTVGYAGLKSFTPYKEKTNQLVAYLKECEQQVPELQRQKRKNSYRVLVNGFIGLIAGIIITIAGTYFYDNYFKKDVTPSNTPKTNKTTPLLPQGK